MDNINENYKKKFKNILKNHNFLEIGEHNSVIKRIKNIISNQKPNPEKFFVADGIWAQNRILETNTQIDSLIICPDCVYTNEAVAIIEKLAEKTKNLYIVSQKTYEKIAERDKPDGLMSIAKLPMPDIKDFKPREKSVILVLDGIEIPGNIGTMLRACDGAGVDAVFICNRRARLTHPKLIKGSMGAVLTIPMFEFSDVDSCYQFLKNNGYTIFLADTRAKNTYFSQKYPSHTAFVMGNERHGISREWYSYPVEMISIPMLGKCDSLNVGVSATILIYDASMKLYYDKK